MKLNQQETFEKTPEGTQQENKKKSVEENHAIIRKAIREILQAVGENPDREGLLQTPDRVARMYDEILLGNHTDPKQHLLKQFTEDKHSEMVIVKDIPVYSMCEHHMLPFYGVAHVAYIPRDGIITGLSKLARTVDGYARRLQLQERLTSQVADAIMEVLNPLGALVIIEAEHMCMTMRGVQKPGCQTVTSAVRGTFEKNTKTRAEALSLIKG